MASYVSTSKKRRRRIVLIALLVLLAVSLGSCCAVLALSGAFGSHDTTSETPTSAGGVVVLDDSASAVSFADVVDTVDAADDDDDVTIPGWGELDLIAGQREQTVDFYNPEDNAGAFYLTFSLEIDADGGREVIYSSGLIEPGLHVSSITLSRTLAAGTYDAVVHVQPYRMDSDVTPTNNADMRTVLVVE
jgi:hypothetical protein